MPAAASPRSAAARPKPTAPPTGPTARRDPRPRHTDGTSPWMKLDGKRADRWYIAVAKTGTAIEEYEAKGYEVCRYGGPDGLRFSGGRTARRALGQAGTEGDVLESFGHVMMEIDLETHLEQEQHGDGFGQGQAYGDAVEKRMRVGRGGMEDPFRGMASSLQRVIRVGNNNSGVRELQKIMPEHAAVEGSAEETEAMMTGDEGDLGAFDNDGDV